MKILRLFFVALVLTSAVPAFAEIPSADVYAKAQLALPKVSPDGTKFCVVANNGRIDVITLFDSITFEPTTIADLNNTELIDYWWKGNDFLVLLVEGSETGYRDFRGLTLSTKKPTNIARINWRSTRIMHPLAEDPDHLLVSSFSGSGWDLRRLNIRNGKSITIEKNPGNVDHWLIRADGTPLAALGSQEKVEDRKMVRRSFLLWRKPGQAEWQRAELGRIDEPGLQPVAVHPDQTRLIAWDTRPAGTASVVAFTPDTFETELLFNAPLVNPSHLTVWGDDEFAAQAIEYEFDTHQRVYFGPEAQVLHAAIDAALPGSKNNILSQSLDKQVMTVRSEKENAPDHFYLLNRRSNRLIPLGAQFSGFPSTDTARGQHFAFEARDGLTITGRVLYPARSVGRAPLIVMTPEWLNGLRTSSEFDRFKQALVSSGYAVAQINWRGTVGFGRSFSEAGDFQIESGLPNDLEDGTRWLISQGKVDPRRVALFTRGWGGFPALRTLASPGLFSVWINFNTRIDYRDLNYEALAFSLLDEREVIQARGGRKAAEAYKRTLNALPVVTSLQIPQFHHYSFSGDEALGILRNAQKKTGAPAVFHFFKRSNHAPEIEEQQPALLDDLRAFLRQHLPVDGVP